MNSGQNSHPRPDNPALMVGKQLTLFQWIVGFFFIELTWTFVGGGATFLVSEATRNHAYSSTSWIIYITQHVNFVILCSVLLIFIFKAVRVSFLTYITDAPSFRWRLFWFSVGVWLIGISLTMLVTALIEPKAILFNATTTLANRLFLMLIALILTPIQCIAEELLFRTTLWRMLAHRVKRGWVISAISGIIFTLAHLSNLEVQSSNFSLPILGFYFLSGYLFMEMTRVHGGTEAAFGAHIANNMFLALVINYAGSSLTSDPWFIQQNPSIWLDLLVLVTCSAIIIRYGQRWQHQ